MEEIQEFARQWNYHLVLAFTDEEVLVKWQAFHPGHGLRTWDTWSIPLPTDRLDDRYLRSMVWEAATELLERMSDL